MFEELIPIALFLSITYILVGLTRILTDARTRRQLIQAGLAPEQVRAILSVPRRDPDRDGALKWGLVTASVGLALILLQFLPYRSEDPISYGLILLSGGAGLLAYVLTSWRRA